MGDDALRALKLCMESQGAIFARLQQDIPVLTSALKWSRKVFLSAISDRLDFVAFSKQPHIGRGD